MDRRRFLRGLGGVTLALPFLETFATRAAFADPLAVPRYAVFMRQANGVAQAWGGADGEQEMFWPRNLGALTTSSLEADSDRAISELKDYASKMLLVRGCRYNFPGNGCGHSGGGNQCLTAQRVSDSPSGNESLAMGESLDNRIARELNPSAREPLTLYVGPMYGYLDEVLSYRGSKQLRAAEPNPWNAYQRMMGLSGVDPEVLNQVAKR